ncbi:MAG TPA: TolC family protein, partial [Gammaproteobacteria bacterium]
MSLSIRRALALACAAALMGVAAPAASQTLTLASAIEKTLASNPELRVYTPRLTAARARAAQAALKPPLEFQSEVQDAFGTGRASGFDIAETTFALSQVVELGGKRERRADAA